MLQEVIEILKYLLPQIIVFLTAYFLISKFVENELKIRRTEYRNSQQNLVTPIKLQAYERLTLFLERISPNSLIPRVQEPKLTAKQMQSLLLSSIRAEFEHNLSQQIYVTPDAWKVIKSAKENVIKLINSVASELKDDASAFELSKTILEKWMKAENTPTNTALIFLKNEVSSYL